MTLPSASYRLNSEPSNREEALKKETIITAVVFSSVGFLAGYVYNAQKTANALESRSRPAVIQSVQDKPPAGNGAMSPEVPGAASGGAAPGALPPGHPPIDATATIKLLEDQAVARPDDVRPRLELANFLYDQKQFEQAIPWYQKALEIDPKNVNARTDLGTSYFRLGRSEEATREYRKSLKVDPNHQPTLYNMILANVEGTHDVAEARRAWEKLSRLNPNYPGLDKLKRSLDAATADPAGSGRR